MKKTYITVVAIIIYSACLFSQTSITQPETIDAQFENLIKTSSNWEDYKMIKKFKINDLKDKTSSHIKELNSSIATLNMTIDEQKKQISKLESNLQSTQSTLDSTNEEKDSINFFGAAMSKASYSTLVWSIAGVLLLGLLFFIFKFKNSQVLTKQAKRKLESLELDFEDYKRKALEKEQKMGRQLQDEKNKLAKLAKG